MHDVTKWAAAVPTLIGLGLALGLNPALYGATADSLARGVRVWPRLFWMLLGLCAGATVLVIALHSFNPDAWVSLVSGHVHAVLVNRIFDLIAGIAFLVAAASVIIWRIKRPTLQMHEKRAPSADAHPISFLTLGLSCSVIGFTTLPIAYLTGQVVIGLGPNPVLRGLAYLVFLVALVAPFVVLALVWSRFPKATARVTSAYTRALQWDYRWLTALILVLAGLVALAFAIWHR